MSKDLSSDLSGLIGQPRYLDWMIPSIIHILLPFHVSINMRKCSKATYCI
jgi:hypothetical protein